MSKKDSIKVPLGYIAEIRVSTWCGLGMLARTMLTDDERVNIGPLGQRILVNPFDYLSDFFDEAWYDAAPGERLMYLSERHCHALHFAVPTVEAVSQAFSGKTFISRQDVRTDLLHVLDSYGAEFLSDPKTVQEPTELWELAAA